MSGYDALMSKGSSPAEEVIEQQQAAPEVQPAEVTPPAPTGEQNSATPPANEPAPVAQEAAPPAAQQREWTVPGQALLSEREARKALQRRLDEIERNNAEAQAKRPDPLVEPEEFLSFIEQRVQEQVGAVRHEAQRAIIADRVANSADRWTKELGEEKWGAMNDWLLDQPPQFREHLKQQRDPYALAHKHWVRTTTIERLGDKDPDAWFAEEAARRGYAPAQQEPSAPAAQPAAVQSPPPPPQAQTRRSAPSLADVVGSTTTSDTPASGYDSLFKR